MERGQRFLEQARIVRGLVNVLHHGGLAAVALNANGVALLIGLPVVLLHLHGVAGGTNKRFW